MYKLYRFISIIVDQLFCIHRYQPYIVPKLESAKGTVTFMKCIKCKRIKIKEG